ncbi:hypothetical protein SNE40_009106 [Patella caerulea]|uniref:Uncharacterized protein n=1 Tax=Patella caerulea TaxID=87958 RepID=A0AAN8JSV6_PATCE
MADFVENDKTLDTDQNSDAPADSNHNQLSIIFEQIDKIIGNNGDLSKEQKERCKHRFREIFETAYTTLITPQKEEEPVRRNWMEYDLTAKLDDAVKDIATIRKKQPIECTKAYTDKLNKEIIHMNTLNVCTGPSRTCPAAVLNVETNLFTKLHEMKEKLLNLSKNTTCLVDRAVRLNTAIDIENSNKNLKRQDDGCSSPQRKRQRTHTTPTKPKVLEHLRRSPRLKSAGFNTRK